MKKILVLGTGAQGSTAARKLDQEPGVGEIICADYDKEAVDNLVKDLKKAKGIKVDAKDKASVLAAAQGVDLIVNALPLEWTKNVLEAALEVKADYQDYAGTTALHEDWVENFKIQLEEYSPKFKAIGKTAIIGTGAAPGVICVATRHAMRYLDTCDTIYNICWEGVRPKAFIPFWWSPITALHDMSEDAYAMKDGKLVRTEAFGEPITRKYDYMENEITFTEHCHDEPIQYYLNAKEYFKGVKNVYFKYAGDGMDFCKPLRRAGLLSHEKEDINGVMVSPFEVIAKHLPHPPKFKEEIQAIIDEGLYEDSGAMVAEAYGKKDGKDILVEVHMDAPGLIDSFKKAGLTAEMYLTGQGGYLYSKMLINNDFDTKGLFTSDMLTMEQVDRYIEYAGELDIYFKTTIKEL